MMQELENKTLFDLVGKSYDDALRIIEGLGRKHRVVRRDGVPAVVTADCQPNRVNLSVACGKVTTVSFG